MPNRLIQIFCLIFLLASCQSSHHSSPRKTIELSGTWKFAMDSAQIGISEKWFTQSLSDSVVLPGTMDENHKGIPNPNRNETMHLSRELLFEGMAWYQKNVNIPSGWKDDKIILKMERTKVTKVWIDTTYIGTNDNLLTPQNYDLSKVLVPGTHRITIVVNNGTKVYPKGVYGSHALSEHTQTNWNGIIGKFQLEALPPTHIEDIQIYPDTKNKIANVRFHILNPDSQLKDVTVMLSAETWNTKKPEKVLKKSFQINLSLGDNSVDLNYPLGEEAEFWSEFSPSLYKLNISIANQKEIDNCQVDFGLRDFRTEGTQFTINGKKTFLRGKHDACVFPLTAHPPMDTASWIRVFKIAKSYGINHYRFHSWTPPLAAFKAADIEGIYLQPELPYWGSIDKKNTRLNEFLLKEGDNISKIYGNEPSFVMFALGNELSGDVEVMQDFVKHFRKEDRRRLYSFGSNNFLGFHGQEEGEDYLVTCRVGGEKKGTFDTHVRASFSFADAYEGGIINGEYPSTTVNYEKAISRSTVPVIGHEITQYQVYPDYSQLKKYTGVLKPWNLEIFRKRLEENHMADQATDFFKASGALCTICFRADIEIALRTPGFGGFQLLDLQDFPGQGTALVGILDAFMDSKGLISPKTFSEFCNRVVPLFEMDKYCWTNNETFSGTIEVANYSANEMKNQPIKWELRTADSTLIAENSSVADISQGGLTKTGEVEVDLSGLKKAQKLRLTLSLPGTIYKNSYPVWVYPEKVDTRVPETVVVSDVLNKKTLESLQEGKKVLLVPDHKAIRDLSVGGLFTPDYWNYAMFKGISERAKKPVSPGTLSILTDPDHPVFNDFPTESHTDWQWWIIVKNSRPFILDHTPADYQPIVQVVDNIDRNHKLGLLFEFKIGKGKLLVSMVDLKAIQEKPEGRQFYSAILNYMKSNQFDPKTTFSPKELTDLFSARVADAKITGVKNISYQ